jgi:hypothetical protein
MGEGIAYFPVAQLPRSMIRQRSLQKGNSGASGATSFLQMGQVISIRRTNGQSHRFDRHAADAENHRIGGVRASQTWNYHVNLIQPDKSRGDPGELHLRRKPIRDRISRREELQLGE